MRRNLKPGEDLDDMLVRAAEFFGSIGPDMILQEVSAIFGVLCLAAAVTDSLVWAHYSDGHRGFAVGFDISHSWFQRTDPPMPPIDAIDRVKYQIKRPKVRMVDHYGLQRMDKRPMAGVGGALMILFWIDEEGSIHKYEIKRSSSNNVLDEAAERVVPVMKFRPAYKRGRPVKIIVALLVRFESY